MRSILDHRYGTPENTFVDIVSPAGCSQCEQVELPGAEEWR